jgi:hypothetical protein
MNLATRVLKYGRLVLVMSIFFLGVGNISAATKEPGPFEKLFRSIGHAFSGKPQHKSTTHRTTGHKQSLASPASPAIATSPAPEEPKARATGGTPAPPNESNTRTTTRAVSRKGDDFRYGMPVPGKKGFVTSPYSPDSGYIDVRGFQPGTPVKDPYSGKIILTP